MAFSLFMIILFPIIGYIGDRWSLVTSFRVMAATAAVISLLFIFIVLKTAGKASAENEERA